jgi:cysteine synthase
MKQVKSSLLEVIGETPLVALSRVTQGLHGQILAKLDYLNPGFSKKDRAALRIVEEAEQTGMLQPGQTVVELTSGNMGTGLAIVCGIKGYPLVTVMSRGNSAERAIMMRSLGAEVVLVDQCADSVMGQVSGADLARVEVRTQEIVLERRAFRADQFHRDGNWHAHRDGTAQEFLRQAGTIDAFCDFVGSGGTLAGCAAGFKAHDARIRCYAVEPAGAAVLANKTVINAGHQIQGGGYAIRDLSFIQREHIDGYLQVTDQEAIAAARLLARKEGIFAGFSTGANLAAALQLLRGPFAGKTVAMVACDSGLKYLSTELWKE